MNPVPPSGWIQFLKMFGEFKYAEGEHGLVNIEGTYVRDNMVVLRNCAGTGVNIQLHRVVAPIFLDGFTEAVKACPGYKIRMLGGHAARHQRNDPKAPLSIHSWGAAFDMNWDTNPMGPKLITDIPPEFCAVMKRRGWVWGGDFARPDSMHWQWAVGI